MFFNLESQYDSQKNLKNLSK